MKFVAVAVRRFSRISINRNRSVVSGRGALLGLRRPLDRSLMSEERWTFVAETNNRHPALVPLPPVPTFMGRGTARRPVEPPAPAPSYGAMVGNPGAPEPRPVDEVADGGVFADY